MTTFILVICVLAFFIWLGRLLRQRELKKFRDVDAQMLNQLREAHPESLAPDGDQPSTPMVKDEKSGQKSEENAAVKTAARPSQGTMQTRDALSALVQPTLKSQALDARTQQMLTLLEGQLGAQYRVLISMPVSQFVSTSEQGWVSFLIVNEAYAPVLAVEFFDAGMTDALLLLKSLQLPYIRVEGTESAPSMRLKLKTVRPDLVELEGVERRCPQCHSSMNLREPKSGKNAGKRYWLCQTYPRCRGVIEV